MPQQQSPWLEGAYGWNFGEGGWNTGMDENLLKFSFMFDGNVDSVVASLPPVSNGAAHFNSTDNRFYFGVGTVWYSSPCPKSFIFKIKSNGHFYQFNGTAAVQIDSPAQLDSRLDAVELTVASLGTAAFEDVSAFATQAELDVVEGQAQGYTDALRGDLADSADPAKGASLVGHSGRTLSAKLLDMVSVMDFGAVPDGSAVGGTDNTAAFNAALATGRKVFVPSGGFRIKGTIIVPPGASLVGDGRTISNIFVTPDYDMTVSAFIRLGHASEIRDIGIKFVQPDSSNRATLTAYPWAIDFNDSTRVVIDFVRVSSAWNAITGTGNTGGSYIGFIEVGALNTGLTIDGALDFFHGLKWHFWPFFTEPDLANATNLLQAFGDGQATAFSLGAVDGFNVENIATFQQKFVIKTNANPVIPNLFGHMQLDGNGARLIVSGGVNAVGKLYDTKSSVATTESVMVEAGVLDVGYFRVSSDAQQHSAKVYNSAKLHIHSGDIQSVNPLGGAVFVQGGIAILEDCTMSPAPGTAYSNAYCVNANGIMKVRRCRWTTRGAGSGTGIFFVPDNVENEAVQNFLGGWGLGWNFSGRPIGIYANNTGAGYDFVNSDLTGFIKSASYQATSNAAGNLTLPHGVSNLHLKLLRADAYYRGNSGEAVPCAVVGADDMNLYIEGAQPSRAVRVSIQYTDNPLSTW